MVIPPLIERDEIYFVILAVVLIMFVWRMLNRIRATWVIYGPLHGFMAVPRLFAGNVLNFFATCVALDHFVKAKISGKIPEWEKTDHAFPTEEQLRGYHHRLGDFLLEKHFVSADQLVDAVKLQKNSDKKLGNILVETGVLWEEDLVHALALQNSKPDCEIDPFMTPKYLFKIVSLEISEKYHISPLSINEDILVLATDNFEAELAKNEIENLLKMQVLFKWCAVADIEFARQKAYIEEASAPPPASRLGEELMESGGISEDVLCTALRKQKRTNKRLGDVLVDMGVTSEKEISHILEAHEDDKSVSEKRSI